MSGNAVSCAISAGESTRLPQASSPFRVDEVNDSHRPQREMMLDTKV